MLISPLYVYTLSRKKFRFGSLVNSTPLHVRCIWQRHERRGYFALFQKLNKAWPCMSTKALECKENETVVINDPLGQTIVTPVANIVFCCFVFLDLKSGDLRTCTDVRTTCAKTIIPTGCDFGLAEWINKSCEFSDPAGPMSPCYRVFRCSVLACFCFPDVRTDTMCETNDHLSAETCMMGQLLRKNSVQWL